MELSPVQSPIDELGSPRAERDLRVAALRFRRRLRQAVVA
jgi:hypothetical protein